MLFQTFMTFVEGEFVKVILVTLFKLEVNEDWNSQNKV